MTGPVERFPRELLDEIAREAELLRPRPPSAARPRPRPVPALRVHVVCYEELDAWILGKIARRLHGALRDLGVEASLGRVADPRADVNHHVIYWDYVERAPTLESVMITHVDEPAELRKVQRQLGPQGVEMGICMSWEAVHRLARLGAPREKLCHVSPAHDGLVRPRPLRIGITTRLYPDARKREHLLPELAAHLSPAEFGFVVMGAGWEPIVAELRRRGFGVEYHDAFSAPAYHALLPQLDYFLYLGQDEGSMGFLDALAAGVPTIVTAQGFHLDVPGGITHRFADLADLRGVFDRVAAERRARVQAVAGLTWEACAARHLRVWEYLACRRSGSPLDADLRADLADLAVALPD